MIEINRTTNYPVDRKKITLLAARFLRLYKRSRFSVSLALVGAARIKTLNYRYRRTPRATDVLSFPAAGSALIKNYLGEIIINTNELKKPYKYQAMFKEIGLDFSSLKKQKKYRDYLLYFLLVHGLLHLVGYDDKTEPERLRMLQRGRDFLRRVV
ncbi:MAG: rRNA maturation RNAse YbeY [Patescibacteria group bacterium]